MPNPVNDWSVIVDFTVEKGLLFLTLRNQSDLPVFHLSLKFSKNIEFSPAAPRGLPFQFINDLPLFKGIPFFAPRREHRVFIDNYASYMMRGQPMDNVITVTYITAMGGSVTNNIPHKLDIYRCLAEVAPAEISNPESFTHA